MSISFQNSPEPERSLTALYSRLDSSTKERVLDRSWFWRVARGLDAIGQEEGRVAEVALLVGTFAATLFVGIIGACSAWGAYEMTKHFVVALDEGEVPSSDVGHAGEWSAQVILYTFFYSRLIHRIVRAGDYREVAKVHDQALRAHFNRSDGDELERSFDALEIQAVQNRTQRHLNEWGHGTLIHKNPFHNYQEAWALVKDHYRDGDQAALTSKRVAEVSRDICHRLKQATAHRRYIQRSWKGFRTLMGERGCSTTLRALVSGVAMPILLAVQSAASVLGVSLIIYELAAGLEGWEVIGHVGEWPINALGFAALAVELNRESFAYQGDIAFARAIIEETLSRLDADSESHEVKAQVLELGEQTLRHYTNRGLFTHLPSEYLSEPNLATEGSV